MKLNYSISILLILSLMGSLSAQKNYIVTDTSKIIGVNLVNNGEVGNAKACEWIENGHTITLSPYELTEYGFANGTVYVSKDIFPGDSVHRVFLEKLTSGPASLYYYKDETTKFFILEKDSGNVMQLSRKAASQNGSSYHYKLTSYTSDCKNVDDAVKLVSYNKKMMIRLTEQYNNCELKPFPFFKFGVFAGYGLSDLKYIEGIGNTFIQQVNPYFKNADFKYDGGFIFGLFIDQPLAATNFTIHPEISLTKNNYSSEYELEEYYVIVEINTASFNIPVVLRYYFPVNTSRPYISFGGIYAYQFKEDFSMWTMPADEGEYPAPVVNNQLGMVAGIGYQFDLTYRMRLYIDCRYNYLYGLKISGQESYNKNEFQFTAGFSL